MFLGCARATNPGEWAKVSNYIPWLREHISGDFTPLSTEGASFKKYKLYYVEARFEGCRKPFYGLTKPAVVQVQNVVGLISHTFDEIKTNGNRSKVRSGFNKCKFLNGTILLKKVLVR